MPWAMTDAVNLVVDKLADKKLSAIGKGLLTNLCTVCYPKAVIVTAVQSIESVRSPVAHEECQHWFKSFCNEFGAASLGNGITEIVPWLLKVCKFVPCVLQRLNPLFFLTLRQYSLLSNIRKQAIATSK